MWLALKGGCITPEYFSHKGSEAHITLSQKNTRQLWIPAASLVQSVPKTLQQVSRAVQQKHPWTPETRKIPQEKKKKRPNCVAMAEWFKHQAANPPREQHLLRGKHSLRIQAAPRQRNQNLWAPPKVVMVGKSCSWGWDQAGEYFSL